jgi:glycosyltransferase involved in cell wall biosynthesis
MWKDKSVTVVFPAYNEEPNIAQAVREFLSLKKDDGSQIVDTVLVVNNNSKDRTDELARAAGAQVVLETRQGYGNALQRGLREAEGELIVLCEPDGTFVPQDITKLLAYESDFEMVCGTRTTRELIWDGANMGKFLRWGNWVVAKLLQFLYNTSSLSDVGCTFRLIHRRAAGKVIPYLTVGKSHFLPDMVIAAKIQRISMIEIPMNYRSRIGESKITGNLKGAISTGTAMIRLILARWPEFMVSHRKLWTTQQSGQAV